MHVYLASGNRHKQEEFAAILKDHHISLPADAGITFDPEETGTTFLENALLKARLLYESVRCPVIADDSGLCIDALGGKPGIYSARYGMKNGVQLKAEERNQLVLQQMEGVENRRCRFVCCIAVILDFNRFFTVQETCEGIITESEIGSHGFGYDPIFRPEGCPKTFAELSSEEKNAMSHRGRAVQRLARYLHALPLDE